MKLDELYKVVRRNWIVKLVCFVLAVFIYFFYRTATIQGKTLVIPLQVAANGLVLPAETTPSHVKVSVRGRPQDLPRISEQNIAAYLNLDYYTESGEYDVPIKIILSPEIMEIHPLEVSTDKGHIRLEVAPKVQRQIPVSPFIQGTPEAGYEVVAVSIDPSTVGVFGVETLLKSMDSIQTEQIPVDGKNSSFFQTVPIRRDSSLVTYSDTSVKVHVDIQPITMTRKIVDQMIYLYGVNPSLVAYADLQMISFTLKGNQSQLVSFVPEPHTVRVDCSPITEPGTYVLPVEVVLPNGIRLTSQSDRTAAVSFVPAGEEVEVVDVVAEDDSVSQFEAGTQEGDSTPQTDLPAGTEEGSPL